MYVNHVLSMSYCYSVSLSQLLVWPEHCPECITMVTIAPEFHGSRHYGYVSNLRKFTWYETAVLCFTTPGDGPASTPQLIQTHADSEYTYKHMGAFTPKKGQKIQMIFWLKQNNVTTCISVPLDWLDSMRKKNHKEDTAMRLNWVQMEIFV